MLIKDFLKLFYPDICLTCSNVLNDSEKIICLSCEFSLPYTNFHTSAKDNQIIELFAGKTIIESASSCFFYQKGLKVQKLMHLLKYKKRDDVGYYLGNIYGKKLQNTEPFCTADFIVPVPLHKKKLKTRGYNQSEVIAIGISENLKISVDNTTLIRARFTETQTKKSIFQRWENVSEMFEISDKTKFSNKHIILVDDVITTGSTIEACANEILKCENSKVSVLTIACAMN